MTKQIPFTAHRPDGSIATNQLWMRVTKIPNLEYAVLMAHVFVYEDLCWLLGIRLHADTLPGRMPLFDAIIDLALAGSKFVDERAILRLLNSARNQIAHRTNRQNFEANVQNFCRRLWSDKTYGSSGFKWRKDESKQVDAFWFAVGVLSAKLGDAYDTFVAARP